MLDQHTGHLEEAGSSLDKLVGVTIVLADEDDFAGMNEEWLKWFPANPPARQGAKLPARIPGLKNLNRGNRRGLTLGRASLNGKVVGLTQETSS